MICIVCGAPGVFLFNQKRSALCERHRGSAHATFEVFRRAYCGDPEQVDGAYLEYLYSHKTLEQYLTDRGFA